MTERWFKHVFRVGIVQYGEVMYHCEADTTQNQQIVAL